MTLPLIQTIGQNNIIADISRYRIIIFSSLCKIFFRCHAPFLMLGNPGENGCVKVRFPVHGGWDSRDVGVFDCVKDCTRFVMYLII